MFVSEFGVCFLSCMRQSLTKLTRSISIEKCGNLFVYLGVFLKFIFQSQLAYSISFRCVT